MTKRNRSRRKRSKKKRLRRKEKMKKSVLETWKGILECDDYVGEKNEYEPEEECVNGQRNKIVIKISGISFCVQRLLSPKTA